MAATATIVSGVAGRYATALFEIAQEGDQLSEVERNLTDLEAALQDSADLRDLISSPLYSREEQGRAMGAVTAQMGLSQIVSNTVALMASKRRLFTLPDVIKGVKALAAQARGEVTADVVSAAPMTDAQKEALTSALKASVGSEVVVNATVDESLIGGLVVKVGSRMIDTSIKAKLASLQNVMKEVG
ncbi:F-type H+-transporting ATPase subunit delta [Rubricella aquisinus]|uniref:ATP synthase subunit delta n=1 Tax=Rubricella aquisinus TaxID=2028108 RepID=A0A840WG25_9RHOB|nr:F0F1 ATP synthase subunit delta [Rubricella aquisinus]MBB5514108.1 F-type H+-transporting ATPase subunit delta [Rubricella aquisinus]